MAPCSVFGGRAIVSLIGPRQRQSPIRWEAREDRATHGDTRRGGEVTNGPTERATVSEKNKEKDSTTPKNL